MIALTKKMKKTFIVLSIVFVFALILTSLVIGIAGGVKGWGLLGVCFFLTVGIVVILGQLIPAGIVLSSFIVGVISSLRKKEVHV
jgi:hypothetical protein